MSTETIILVAWMDIEEYEHALEKGDQTYANELRERLKNLRVGLLGIEEQDPNLIRQLDVLINQMPQTT